MTEWVYCPKCGALMVGLTGSHVCPVCRYTVPVQTVTATTGTGEWYIYEPPKPNKSFVEVIRCKDCTHWHTSYCPMAYLEYELGRGNEPMDFCSLAERKEE